MEGLFPPSGQLDIIPVGRVAIDFNPTDYNRPLSESSNFNKYLGGSPANIAVGMARLGNRVGFRRSVRGFCDRLFRCRGHRLLPYFPLP